MPTARIFSRLAKRPAPFRSRLRAFVSRFVKETAPLWYTGTGVVIGFQEYAAHPEYATGWRVMTGASMLLVWPMHLACNMNKASLSRR